MDQSSPHILVNQDKPVTASPELGFSIPDEVGQWQRRTVGSDPMYCRSWKW
jgi:hypothetical protein